MRTYNSPPSFKNWELTARLGHFLLKAILLNCSGRQQGRVDVLALNWSWCWDWSWGREYVWLVYLQGVKFIQALAIGVFTVCSDVSVYFMLLCLGD